MVKKTQRKLKKRPKKMNVRKKSIHNKLERNVVRTKRKKQQGGDDMKSTILGVLSERYIPFLPATAVINDKGLIRDYLSSVSAFTLLTLIGKNDKFINSNSINGLIEDVDNPPGFGAFWGEVNSAIHLGFGVKGLVTNGVIRDLDQWANGFAALAGSVGPSHAYTQIIEYSTDVNIYGMVAQDKDIIHFDIVFLII